MCSVCIVDSYGDIDAGRSLGRCKLGLNPGFDHVNHDTRALCVRTRVRVRVRVKV